MSNFHFSYTQGEPFAVIRGGKNDGQQIFITDKPEKHKINNAQNRIKDDDIRKHKKRMTLKEIDKIRRHLDDSDDYDEFTDDDMQQAYNNSRAKTKATENREINIIDNSQLEPLSHNDHPRFYVAGPSESGKSFICGKIIDNYMDQFGEIPFTIFSRLAEDENLDDLNPKRIVLDEEILKEGNELKPEEFNGNIVLFDDIDTIPQKKVADAIRRFRDDILETGRHESIASLSTSHQLMNYKMTRGLINDATHVIFFPRSGSAYQIKRFLKEYCGLDPRTVQRILNVPSRWVMIRKIYPLAVLSEKGAFFL